MYFVYEVKRTTNLYSYSSAFSKRGKLMYHTMIEHQREENREKGYTCFVLPTENMMHPIEKINK